MNNDEVLIKNQKLMQDTMSVNNCHCCTYFKNKGCTMYIPNKFKCLILIKYYSTNG